MFNNNFKLQLKYRGLSIINAYLPYKLYINIKKY